MSDKSLLKDGQTVVFLGDSITQAEDGYVSVTEAIIGALIPDLRLTYVNSGVSGNNVRDMLNRIAETVIVHDPDWITVSVGVNDVWHGQNGIAIEEFRDKYGELVERLQKQTVAKLVLFTTTVIGEDLDGPGNKRLIDYNEHIRSIAKKRDCLLVDLNTAFHDAISRWQKHETELRFTTDGVHMTPVGAYLMAHMLAKAWKVL